MMMKRWQIFLGVFLAIGMFVVLLKKVPYQNDEGRVFGTMYRIVYKSATNFKGEIEKELENVNKSLSPFNETSIISKINNNEEVVPDSMFEYVFDMAQNVSEMTEGKFDITVAPLVNAWGFGFKKGITPDSATIDSIKKLVGYSTVRIENGVVKKQNSATMLNCSAIAKGYACDVIARFLDGKGIHDYMVEIGGEVVVQGKNEKDTSWIIGVNKPLENANAINSLQTVLQITDCAMATSGNYRNFRYENGKKYSHTIDPHTGYPVQHSLLSATVVTRECAYADAIATAFMVMGVDDAMKFCEKHPEIEAFFIYSDNEGEMKTIETAGFGKYKKQF